MPPKGSSSSHRRRNPKLLRVKTKHKSLRSGNKSGLHAIPNVDAHVLSVATFLRMYPHSPSQDQFYTILRKTKTFRCFYSFVNEVFGNMDEQLFSVLFLSFMITTSGETSSFSFKDFIIRAVPNIEAAQIDEIDAGMVGTVNGLSNLVYEECVMIQKSSVGPVMHRVPLPAVTARRVHKPQTHTRTRRLRRLRRPRLIGGKRNIRKTRTNKKYVQTGGVLLFIAELITILFEIRRRINSNGNSVTNWILPIILLLFFMLEISGQFSSIDYFGIGAGAPGGSAAAATTDGNLSEFIAGASVFMEWLKDHAPAAVTEGQSVSSAGNSMGYGSAAGIPSYASAQSTAAQRSAAIHEITSNIFSPQRSAISAIQKSDIEQAFELSPLSGRLTFKDFLMCLNIPDIVENASHIAALLRESQDAGMIPESILVSAPEIQEHLFRVFDVINDQFVRMTGESGVQIQCARSEGRPDTVNDRLYVHHMHERDANAYREECAFNGYVRTIATGTFVLSSKSALSILRRIYKLIGLLFSRPRQADPDRKNEHRLIGPDLPPHLKNPPDVLRPIPIRPPGATSPPLNPIDEIDQEFSNLRL
jgi:hypothetical protein